MDEAAARQFRDLVRGSPALLSGVLAITLGLPAPAQEGDAGPSTSDAPRVHLTWMSIANWLFELNDVRILMNGYFTRVPAPSFFGGGGGLAFTQAAFPIDVPMVLRVREAIGAPIQWVYTGHSHFDHSWDSPLWAALTGAQLIGSRSTCLQAQAQNLPSTQCSELLGGEQIHFGEGVTGYVVRWNHSGNSASNPEQHNPIELVAQPLPDPVTGGFRAGVSEDYPNGGGGRMMLFVVERGGLRLSFFVNDSASATDLAAPILVDGVNYGAPIDNLSRALAEAGLDSVDLWIGTGGSAVAALVVPVLHPRAYIPNHWDGLYSPFLAGLPRPYADAGLTRYLAAQGISILPQTQYMDGYVLSPNGVERLAHREWKASLGFSTAQSFSVAQSRAARSLSAPVPDDCDAPAH
jgi:L-ascorbate metabolism protein UlaG (beta-lactamase superfamily)